MTPLDQLLLGLALGGWGFTLMFALLWQREIAEHDRTMRKLVELRASLRRLAAAAQPVKVADSLVRRLRMTPEQQLADADHYQQAREYKW